MRQLIRRGMIPGPRLFCAGRLLSITTSTVMSFPGMYEVADGPEQVRAAARRQLAMGADLIKVMATGALTSTEYEDARAIQYTLEELQAAVAIAEANFKHCAAHAHAALHTAGWRAKGAPPLPIAAPSHACCRLVLSCGTIVWWLD